VYLVFKENILIVTLLKRGNKNVDIKFSAHECFWNNLHQVAQNQKIGKPNNLIVLGAQDLWVLMLSDNVRIFCLFCNVLLLKKQLPNCLKRAETDIVLSVLDVCAYIVSFSASLDMNQVPEKLYLGQNLKQYVMKEAVIYKNP
jgi:hypothetical protein